MKTTTFKPILFAIVVLFIILHNDLWLWSSPQMEAGLPVGLLYHVIYCFAASVLFWLLVRRSQNGKVEDGA